MDIDFGKAHRVPHKTHKVRETNFTKLSRKIAVVVSVLIITFTVGLVSGLGVNKFQGTNDSVGNSNGELISPNVSPTLSDDVQIQKTIQKTSTSTSVASSTKKSKQEKTSSKNDVTTSLEQDKYSHLILAKIYEDSNMAHNAGLKLQKSGLPVFLAASGKRMKLYVGPVQGEKNARNLLAKIKKLPDFQGAILYRK